MDKEPKLSDMKDSYSVKEAIEFFKPLITYENNGVVIDKKMLKQLDETARLIPEKGNFFRKRYSGKQLYQYYQETKPR